MLGVKKRKLCQQKSAFRFCVRFFSLQLSLPLVKGYSTPCTTPARSYTADRPHSKAENSEERGLPYDQPMI